jgi:hypothetical protein
MDRKEKLKGLIPALAHFELTEREQNFITLAEESLDRKGVLTEQQESILKGILREKKRWGKKVLFPQKMGPTDPTQDSP